jgi:hypothetical protein
MAGIIACVVTKRKEDFVRSAAMRRAKLDDPMHAAMTFR